VSAAVVVVAPPAAAPAPRSASARDAASDAAAGTVDVGGRRARSLVAAVLLVVGVACVVQAAYIPVKAFVAQVLLHRAWGAAQDGALAPKPWPWADTHPVAKLEVGGRDLVVLEGASGRTLAFGPGHMTGTALPGAVGNAVVGGHRDTHFAVLRDVAVGDELVVETPAGARVTYAVASTRVVDEHDTSVTTSAGIRELTLVTCWPFDAVVPGGPERFVVHAVEVPSA